MGRSDFLEVLPMAERPGVLFRFELLDALEQLDPADAGQLFIAAMRYGKDGTVPTFQNPLLSVVWTFVKSAVDRDAESYDLKVLQKKYAVYVREAKKAGAEPLSFDEWKVSPDISRYQPITGDIHNQEHTQHQYHNHSHSQEQVQEHTQEGTAAVPPVPARDSRGIVSLCDEEYNSLIADLGEQEVRRCIDYLSEYCSMSGKRYKNWSAAIEKCHREGWGLTAPKGAQSGADFQPSAERIQRNNDWLDKFLAEQQKKAADDRWNLEAIRL